MNLRMNPVTARDFLAKIQWLEPQGTPQRYMGILIVVDGTTVEAHGGGQNYKIPNDTIIWDSSN